MQRMSMLLRLGFMTGFAVQVGVAQHVSSEHQIKQKIMPKVTAAAAQVQISYDGTPQFAPIEGTSLTYATNTLEKIIHLGTAYYLCLQNVWVVSADPYGPWKTALFIPQEITTIDCVELGLFNPFGGYKLCAIPAPQYKDQECCVVHK
jgi:hypothetical protein